MEERPRRKRGRDAEHEGPSKPDDACLIAKLGTDLFDMLLRYLTLEDMGKVMQLDRYLLHRTRSNRVYLHAKRCFAAEWRNWKYSDKLSDAAVSQRIDERVAKKEECWGCGRKCRGVKWPEEWRDPASGLRMFPAMCVKCFRKRNPTEVLFASGDADREFGLNSAKRKGLPFVIDNHGASSVPHLYREVDLLKVGKRKAT